jgi:hypothetical protein
MSEVTIVFKIRPLKTLRGHCVLQLNFLNYFQLGVVVHIRLRSNRNQYEIS